MSAYPRRSKFGNVRTEVDGHSFASKAEARRYGELKLLERAGEITHLQLQPSFPLEVQGKKIGRFTGDFAYVEHDTCVVEDVKSPATANNTAYRLRKKLFRALWPSIEFREVM